MVRDHRRAAESDPSFPEVLYVHQGTATEGDEFFERFAPEVSAIADPHRHLYDAFDVRRGRLGQVLGLRSLARGVAAAMKGNGVGKPVGDARVMPGLFLVRTQDVLWAHPFRHAGDHPDPREVSRIAGTLRREPLMTSA